MVGIVIVSHSARLAEGIVELAREMAGPDVAIVAAGGLDMPDRPLGTDAALIMRAVEQAWSEDGVLVLMDLGSAVLSAEMAAEMLPDEQRSKVVLCEAPVAEGAVAAAVAARLGQSLAAVANEARGGLAGKAAHLGAQPGQGAAGGQPPPADRAADAGGVDGGGRLELRIPVTNPLGLHARPAARFVQTAGQFDATVTAENLTTHAGPASARSLNGVATLGVQQGHDVLVRASGPQAAAALAALRELALRNFDEPPARQPAGSPVEQTAAQFAAGESGSPVPAAPPGADERSSLPVPTAPAGAAAAGRQPVPGEILRGIPGSPGIAIGDAVHLRPAAITVPRGRAADANAELARLDAALEATRRQIQAARDSVAARSGAAYEAGIFDAHLLFLDDEALVEPARRSIGAGRNAADAWDSAVRDMAAAWRRLADPYQRERAADVESVGAQVLANLLGEARAEPAGAGVVVAGELTPADTAGFDPAVVRGIATAYGGPTSHAAILARALGIPAVLGLGPAVLEIREATPLLLDGDQGSVLVAPGPADVAAAELAKERAATAATRARQLAGQPAVTVDGVTIEVAANAGSAQDVRHAVAQGADGIGLLRTEFVFLAAEQMPTEAEQEAVYAEIAAILDGRPLIIRTLDVGADKPLPYLPRDAEPNPALGQRGIRLGLARTDLLLAQVRAALRVAASHPVRLMFPMVATEHEVQSALAVVSSARRGLEAEGMSAGAGAPMEVGIMIEVPAAALSAAVLAGEVDFFSVGTNDLTQYTMAADREVSAVAALGDALHPAVLTLIGRAAAAATGAGRWIGVCGELAADPLAVPLLLGLGVRELSVSAASVGAVKQAVRATSLTTAADLAGRALELASAEAVREMVRRRTDAGMTC